MTIAPGELISVGDHYYILASSFTADMPKLVLKHDEGFFVADRRGDFPDVPDSEFGFYVSGTRFLHRFQLRVQRERPLLLNSSVSDDNLQVAVDLTNADPRASDAGALPGRALRLARRLTVYGCELFQTLAIESFGDAAAPVEIAWDFGADYRDVFEVRGLRRARRGELESATAEGSVARLAYRGLDNVRRMTVLRFDPAPSELTVSSARHRLVIEPGERVELAVRVSALEPDAPAPVPLGLPDIVTRRRAETARRDGGSAGITTAHEALNQWFRRSRADLRMLLTDTPDGPVPYAGIPWYVAPFGRDSLITAFQTLPFEPDIARGTLRYLARHQGDRDDAFTDQEPGRILHEYRRGELAACREIVFIPYFGTVDATPLFAMLLAEYLRWTADWPLALELWPSLVRALGWVSGAGDERGYLRYGCRSPMGLVNQGWKDSHDAIMHASGGLASGAIAVVEAQAYKYAALLAGAEIADALGRTAMAGPWRAEAAVLRGRFEQDFWLDQEQFYALALDGEGAPCRVVASNPAHALWAGIVEDSHAGPVAERLMADDMFSGWGVRTLSARARRYNPMSYHNGSVWPHDSAIAAAGLRRYGKIPAFIAIATALFEAALEWEGARMPELFCGFARAPGFGPTRYPVACSPQAWAAGVPFHLLSAMLGLAPEASHNRLSFMHPVLPPWLDWVKIRDLRLRNSTLDLMISRGAQGAAVELLDRRGDAELVVRR